MKRLLVASLTITFLSCTAKTDKNTTVEQFVPPGWKMIQTDIGDLNQDGLSDVVLVVEEDNTANLKQNNGMGVKELNLNPRHLVVWLKTSSGFRKAAEATHFLPSENSSDNPCLSDPMDNAAEDSVQIVGGFSKFRCRTGRAVEVGKRQTTNLNFVMKTGAFV